MDIASYEKGGTTYDRKSFGPLHRIYLRSPENSCGFRFFAARDAKAFRFPASARPMQLNAMITAAGVIEVVCGVMILIGFLAGLAAFIASAEMAVAYFMVYQPMGALPIQNNG